MISSFACNQMFYWDRTVTALIVASLNNRVRFIQNILVESLLCAVERLEINLRGSLVWRPAISQKWQRLHFSVNFVINSPDRKRLGTRREYQAATSCPQGIRAHNAIRITREEKFNLQSLIEMKILSLISR